jgi:hypothetical protein
MKDCTLINSTGNKTAVFKVTKEFVWVDIYDNETNEICETLGLPHNLAEDLKKRLLETTDSTEAPYNGIKVTYKAK